MRTERLTEQRLPAAVTLRTIQLGKGWFPEESGGLNRYYRDLIERLPGFGVGVTGLIAGNDSGPRARLGVRSFAPRDAGLPTRLRAVRNAARHALGSGDPDLVVGHFALYVAPCLDLLEDRALVIHFHGPWADESRAEGAGVLVTAAKRALEKTVYRRANRLVVLSRAFARILSERYGIPGDRIAIVPGGVDTERFAPTVSRATAREALGWPNDRPVVLLVRRLVSRMGLEGMISAVRLAIAEVPDLLVLVAGTGPLAEPLAERIGALGLEAQIRLLGFVPDEDLPLAYRAADLSLVPSIALEGFGLVVAESLAAGTPVLVTPVGGLPETVEALSADCVVRDAGWAALGDAIGGAFRGRVALPSADACIRHARRRFDWAVVGRQVAAIYRDAAR